MDSVNTEENCAIVDINGVPTKIRYLTKQEEDAIQLREQEYIRSQTNPLDGCEPRNPLEVTHGRLSPSYDSEGRAFTVIDYNVVEHVPKRRYVSDETYQRMQELDAEYVRAKVSAGNLPLSVTHGKYSGCVREDDDGRLFVYE